jgi:hypothetical protein
MLRRGEYHVSTLVILRAPERDVFISACDGNLMSAND